MTDASERERLAASLHDRCPNGCRCSLQQAADMLRADAETIRSYEWCNEGLSDNALAFFRENIDLREQLAAQSAELRIMSDKVALNEAESRIDHAVRWCVQFGVSPAEFRQLAIDAWRANCRDLGERAAEILK